MSAVRGLVIVGGGAAGIGAASEAKSLGIDAIVIEAKDRLGGRAHSIEWNGHELDLGCTWMHSAERNSLRLEAERIGAKIERKPTNWFGQFRDLGWSRKEQEEAQAAFAELETRMNDNPPPSDCAADALDPESKWRPWLDALSGYVNGAPLAEVSIADWLAYDNAASPHNLRLARGYGKLISTLGAQFECRLGTPVTAISRTSSVVQVDTAAGVVEAGHVIVTVPTSALSSIRFDPPVSGLVEASQQLPLGFADKLFLSLSDPEEFPYDAHLVGNPRSSQTGSYFLRPMGMPVVEGFFGGDGARALEDLGAAGAASFAIEELSSLLGSGLRKRLQLIAVSSWGHEPFIHGSYSHARPGGAQFRELLAAAGDDRIAFAGEATSRTDYSTAHGAFDSGVSAVRKLFSHSN